MGNKFRRRAFTLVELLMIVLLLTVIAGIAAPGFSQSYRNIIFRKTADDLLDTMRYTQSRAIILQKIHVVQFNVRHTQYWIEQCAGDAQDPHPVFGRLKNRWGRIVEVPRGIVLAYDGRTVHFYPDGTVEKVTISLTSGGRTLAVSSGEQRGQISLLDVKPEEI